MSDHSSTDHIQIDMDQVLQQVLFQHDYPVFSSFTQAHPDALLVEIDARSAQSPDFLEAQPSPGRTFPPSRPGRREYSDPGRDTAL